jgi:hypothetical protein
MKSNLLEPLRPVRYFGKCFELCPVRRFLIHEHSCDFFRDSREETRNLLESGGTDGSFQHPEEHMVALSVSLLCDLCPADLCLDATLLSRLRIDPGRAIPCLNIPKPLFPGKSWQPRIWAAESTLGKMRPPPTGELIRSAHGGDRLKSAQVAKRCSARLFLGFADLHCTVRDRRTSTRRYRRASPPI